MLLFKRLMAGVFGGVLGAVLALLLAFMLGKLSLDATHFTRLLIVGSGAGFFLGILFYRFVLRVTGFIYDTFLS